MTNEMRRAALLLRWQDHGAQTRWQATIENAYTGEAIHFANRSDLMRFLWSWVYGVDDATTDRGSGADTGTGRSET